MNPNIPNTASNAAAPPNVTAAELCRFFELTEESKHALTPEARPDEFTRALLEQKRYVDAVQLLAHYLPKRQAVFWAVSSIRQAGAALAPEAEQALKATERWIAEPSEENRKDTLKAADEADAATPAGCLALGAFYADGLPRTDNPKSNARAHFLTAKLVGSALLLAATAEAEKMEPRFQQFVQSGLEIVKKMRR